MLILKPLLLAEMRVQRRRDIVAESLRYLCPPLSVGDGDDGILSSGFSGSLDAAATCCKARSNIGGKSLPRLSARRRIPAQALALKKYRCGIGPVSKIDDNEHTLASLGQAEILSVEKPPCRPCPWPGNHTRVWPPSDSCREITGCIAPDNCSQETAEGIVVGREDAGDVFPDGITESMMSSKFMCEHRIGERESAARVVERETLSGE